MTLLIDALISTVLEMDNRFKYAKNGKNYSFQKDIVPFTNEVDILLKELKDQAPEFISLPFMNQLKFNILIENIEKLSVECHFESASKKHFKDKLKSVNYDLNYIKESEKQYG